MSCVSCVEDCDDRRWFADGVALTSLGFMLLLEPILLPTGVDFISSDAWLLGSDAISGGEEDTALASDLALDREVELGVLET